MSGNIIHPTVRWVKENEGSVRTTVGVDSVLTFSMECYSDRKSPEILLDFGKKVTGYIVISSRMHSHDYIDVKYGPVENCLILPLRVKMPYGGVYQSEHYITGRYFRISVSSNSLQPQPIMAQDVTVYMLKSQYPVDHVGRFDCDDEDLNTVYQRGAYTLELCMQKNSEACWYRMLERPEFLDSFAKNWRGRYGEYVIFDSPRRDRETWLGDLRVEALLAYTAFDAGDVVKNTLSLFYDIQRKDGSIPGSGSTWMDFLEFTVFGIIASWECYLYTGDRAFMEYMTPYVRKFIGYVDSYVDERGFLYGDGSWMWTLPREGYNAALQILLTEALQDVALLERELHNESEAIRLNNLRCKIISNIQEEFWDEEAGIFRERFRIVTPTMPVPLDANCFAIVFGVATPEQSRRILHYIKEHMWCACGSASLDIKMKEARLEDGLTKYPLIDRIRNAPDPSAKMVRYMTPHNRMVWPFVNAYEVQARLMTGDTDNAFELIRRCWDTERFSETGTYWEIVDPENPVFNFGPCVHDSKDDCFNSAAHGFSGWIAHLLQTAVLGINPIKPGFAEVKVAPKTGKLRRINGAVPTPRGLLTVSIEKNDTIYCLKVTAPEGVEVTVDISEQELAGRHSETAIDYIK